MSLKVSQTYSKGTKMKYHSFNQKQEIERAHLDEFTQFNQFWDHKMKEFDQEAEKIRI